MFGLYLNATESKCTAYAVLCVKLGSQLLSEVGTDDAIAIKTTLLCENKL